MHTQFGIFVFLCAINISLCLPVERGIVSGNGEENGPGILRSASVRTPRTSEETTAEEYLENFGYFSDQIVRSADGFSSAIRSFQNFNGLEETGILDEATKTLMQTPRCGVRDKEGTRHKRRAVDYKWSKKTLKYAVHQNSKDLQHLTKPIIKKAFKIWEDYTPLKFTEVNPGSSNDIGIYFVSGRHNLARLDSPFDGKGGVLAHAFFPEVGDAHFDGDETFTDGDSKGTDLWQVAAHEFGHSLGLYHSNNHDALMAPYYRGYQADLSLHSDDIQRIQRKYGKKVGGSDDTTTTKSTAVPTAKPPPGGNNHCQDGQLDAIASKTKHFTIGFRNNKYYVIGDDRVTKVDAISNIWTEGYDHNSKIKEAIFTRTNGGQSVLCVIQGNKVGIFEVQNGNLKWTNTTDVDAVFAGFPRDTEISGIFNHPRRTGRIFLFSGTQYYRFQSVSTSPVKYSKDRRYPKSIDIWELNKPDLRSGFDAATVWDNRLYFYTGRNYYRYNSDFDALDSGYPRPISKWWFGCDA